LRLLWIATKAPWPPADGGRLLLLESLSALAATSAVEVTLIAPVPRGELAAAEEALRPFCRPRLVATRPRSTTPNCTVSGLMVRAQPVGVPPVPRTGTTKGSLSGSDERTTS
jgi:hypothetical protein